MGGKGFASSAFGRLRALLDGRAVSPWLSQHILPLQIDVQVEDEVRHTLKNITQVCSLPGQVGEKVSHIKNGTLSEQV